MATAAPLPETALLQRYAEAGAYTDCFVTDIERDVSLAEYVEAFYTSWLFKLERVILKLVVGKPSTDADAKALGAGEVQQFAAWTVEDRTASELLMCDFRGQTRSWFMIAPGRLYFGSAVVPIERPIYRWLLGLHRLYSIALLKAARARLQ